MRGPFLEVLLHKDENLITQQCNLRNLELTSLSDCEKQVVFFFLQFFMMAKHSCWAALKNSSLINKNSKKNMKWNKKSTNTQMIHIQVQNQK